MEDIEDIEDIEGIEGIEGIEDVGGTGPGAGIDWGGRLRWAGVILAPSKLASVGTKSCLSGAYIEAAADVGRASTWGVVGKNLVGR